MKVECDFFMKCLMMDDDLKCIFHYLALKPYTYVNSNSNIRDLKKIQASKYNIRKTFV